jgi:hypothetical protein
MKAHLFLTLVALASLVLLSACGPPIIYKQLTYPVCEGRYHTSYGPLGSIYTPAVQPSCRQYSNARDSSGWLEATINSHRLRGLSTLVLGCANLTQQTESCEYGGPEGHAATLDLVFDFTRYDEKIRVRRVVLAIYAFSNAQYLSQTAALRGRLTMGDDFQSLGSSRQPPVGEAGWIQFDITDIAARAIIDRRDYVSFELSLPCTRDESSLSVVGVLRNEPVILVEYL